MKNLLWYLLAGTKGGESRGRILSLLKKKPSNANKLAELLHLDYKTIRHHLDVLEKNNLLIAVNKGNYNVVYFWSDELKQESKLFGEIWAQYGKK